MNLLCINCIISGCFKNDFCLYKTREEGKVKYSKAPRRTNKRACLVVTYHPLLKNIGSIFHKHFDLLYTDQHVDIVFTSDSIAFFRSARKISSYFIRAKLYPLERLVSSFKCRGRRCQDCLNVTETETFTAASANQNYKIKHEFNGKESSFIYLLTCRSVVSNRLDKQLMSFAVDGIIIKLMTESIYTLSQYLP